MNRHAILGLSCSILFLSVVAHGFGQAPPPPPPPPPWLPMPAPSPITRMPDGPNDIGIQAIGRMLERNGHRPQLETVEGTQVHAIMIEKDGFKLPLTVGLSRSGRKVWIVAPLKQFKADETIPTERLIDLLDPKNLRGTGYFVYCKDQRLIKFTVSFDSRSLTATELSRELDEFVKNVISAAPLWTFR